MSSSYKDQRMILERLIGSLEEDLKTTAQSMGYHEAQLSKESGDRTRIQNRIEALTATTEVLRLLDLSGITLKDPEQKLSRTPPPMPGLSLGRK